VRRYKPLVRSSCLFSFSPISGTVFFSPRKPSVFSFVRLDQFFLFVSLSRSYAFFLFFFLAQQFALFLRTEEKDLPFPRELALFFPLADGFFPLGAASPQMRSRKPPFLMPRSKHDKRDTLFFLQDALLLLFSFPGRVSPFILEKR